MRRHRNPQARLSKQAPSDNFNPGTPDAMPDLVTPEAPMPSGTPDAVPDLVTPEAPMPSGTPDAPTTSGTPRFLLGSSTPRPLPLAIERDVFHVGPDPIARVIVFGADESTPSQKMRADERQARRHRAPYKVRADERQARRHRAMSSESAGSSRWWRRGATVAGLIVLLDLVFRVLGSCGGAR